MTQTPAPEPVTTYEVVGEMIKRTCDGQIAWIPMDERNPHYREYLASLEQ
jgi:hypothetical protein